MGDMFKELRKKSVKSRKGIPIVNKDISFPDNVINDFVEIDNVKLKRKRVSLNYESCKVRICTMCPFPNDGTARKIDDKFLFEQLNNAGCRDDDYDILTIYHNGNFFADNEIRPDLRLKIYKYINELNIKHFVVETLPQNINEEKLSVFKENCPNIKLHVAIGVQTMDDFLRKYAILSHFDNSVLDNSINLLKKFNYVPRIFIMFGMPFLTIEESLYVTINDIKIIKKRYNIEENVVICPLVIMPFTMAYDLNKSTPLNAPNVEDINNLIVLLSKNKLKPKITINSSVYEYIGDNNKKEKYDAFKNNLIDFNNKGFCDIDNCNIENNNYKKENIIEKINSYIKS